MVFCIFNILYSFLNHFYIVEFVERNFTTNNESLPISVKCDSFFPRVSKYFDAEDNNTKGRKYNFGFLKKFASCQEFMVDKTKIAPTPKEVQRQHPSLSPVEKENGYKSSGIDICCGQGLRPLQGKPLCFGKEIANFEILYPRAFNEV